MNLKILEEKDNPLFNRNEVKGSIKADCTPSKIDVEKLISEKFSVPAENIQIKKILGKFGSNNFSITANIYKSKENKEKTEPKQKKKGE